VPARVSVQDSWLGFVKEYYASCSGRIQRDGEDWNRARDCWEDDEKIHLMRMARKSEVTSQHEHSRQG